MITIRTLTDPKKHTTQPYTPSHFCDQASDGTPFNSTHLVYDNDSYIGVVFKDFEEYPWELHLAGHLKSRFGGYDFENAVTALLHWDKNRQQSDEEWRNSVGLPIAA